MAKYRPVQVRIWRDQKFMSLSDDGKLLWFFLLTTPSSLSIPGVIVGGKAALAEQMGWKVRRFVTVLNEIEKKGLEIRSDIDRCTIWLPNAIAHQRAANPNAFKSWASSWDEIPDSDLKHDIWDAIRNGGQYKDIFSDSFHEPGKPLRERLPEPLAKPLRERLPEPLAEPIPEPLPERLLSVTGTVKGTGTRERDSDARAAVEPIGIDPLRQLVSKTWDLCSSGHAQLKASGVDSTARNCWAGLPAGSGANELAKRTRELLEKHSGDSGAVWADLQNAVAVVMARAKREGTLAWFTPTRLFDARSFGLSVEASPEQAAKKPTPSPKAFGEDQTIRKIVRLDVPRN